jgi:hypothetical protein
MRSVPEATGKGDGLEGIAVVPDGTIVAGDPFKDRIFKLRLLELTRSCRLDSEHDAMEPIEETASAVSANVRSDGRLAQLDRALA